MGKSTSELSSVTRVGLDLPKNAFNFMASTHKRSRRQPGAQARTFGLLPQCLVAIEACSPRSLDATIDGARASK